MASNKNQHFVPRCYLRPFAVKPHRKTINLFNVDREKVVPDAPIKSQCSRDYFYGSDENLEAAIQTVEGAYASALEELLKIGKALTPESRAIIPRFWLLQHTRTEAASQRMVAMTEDTDELLQHPTESFRLGIKDAVQMGLRAFAENLEILDDLKIVLIRNKTSIPFVTSDDPAVMVNRWLTNNKLVMGPGFGLLSGGLIYVLPLSPDVCCFAYDGHVYSIPSEDNWIELRNETDVNALNDLQYLNCVANTYFDNISDSSHLVALHKRNAGLRPAARHRLHYAVRVESSNGEAKYAVVDKDKAPEHTQALIHMETIRVTPRHWPSFLNWRSDGFVFTNGTGVGHVRKAHIERRRGPAYKKLLTGR